jgi:hypothetical protein
MWEDPRPERLRQHSDQGDSLLLKSLVAYAAIVLVVILLLNAKVIDWGQEKPDAAPASGPAQPARPAGTRPAQPQVSAPPRETNPAPAFRNDQPPASSYVPRNAVRGDPRVLQNLVEICRYWTGQNTQGQYRGNQEMACNDMVSYAREHGLRVPSVGGSGPQVSAPAQQPSSTTRIHVTVNQCAQHGYGSIDYRQCRAAEKRRLTDWCRSLANERDRARGERYETLVLHARAVCSEADRYQIVR